jgi:uncharacterized DUF497 family protein
MDFDWINVSFDLTKLPPKDIEESFEDPFSLKILPDGGDDSVSGARYYCLGRSLGGVPIFSVFWTDGKRYRVIFARVMTAEEAHFYERKKAEDL